MLSNFFLWKENHFRTRLFYTHHTRYNSAGQLSFCFFTWNWLVLSNIFKKNTHIFILAKYEPSYMSYISAVFFSNEIWAVSGTGCLATFFLKRNTFSEHDFFITFIWAIIHPCTSLFFSIDFCFFTCNWLVLSNIFQFFFYLSQI